MGATEEVATETAASLAEWEEAGTEVPPAVTAAREAKAEAEAKAVG